MGRKRLTPTRVGMASKCLFVVVIGFGLCVI